MVLSQARSQAHHDLLGQVAEVEDALIRVVPVGVGVSGTFTDTAAVMDGTALVGKASQIFRATLRKLAELE